MKKTRLLAAAMLLSVALFLLASCGTEQASSETQRPSNVRSELLAHTQMDYTVAFFPDSSGKFLVPLSYRINATRDVVWVAVEKLLSGTPNDFVKDALSEGFKLEDLYLQNGIVYIKLLGAEAEAEAEQINVAAFAATVNFALNDSSFNFQTLYPISILLNNKQIMDNAYTFSNPNSFAENTENTVARIFYSDAQAMYLIPTTVEIKDAAEGDALYLAVLNKWVSAPPDKNLASPVAKGSKVLSATLKNGNLVIDLNKAAVNYGGGHAQETVFVQSLLWTLSSYPEITSVQLTVEGETLATLPEGTSIKTPLTVPHQYQNLNIVEALH